MLVRYHRNGEIRGVRPCRVVEDTPERVVLWLANGTPVRFPRYADGREVRDVPLEQRFHAPWHTADGRWQGAGTLILMRPDSWHSVHWFFTPDGTFRNWYVNTETPYVRWSDGDVSGLDTDDLELDVVVAPDRSWRLKDADEAVAAYEAGQVSAAWAERARVEAETAIKVVEAGQWPYDGTWTDFRPDPAWPLPVLPAGWDRPAALLASGSGTMDR